MGFVFRNAWLHCKLYTPVCPLLLTNQGGPPRKCFSGELFHYAKHVFLGAFPPWKWYNWSDCRLTLNSPFGSCKCWYSHTQKKNVWCGRAAFQLISYLWLYLLQYVTVLRARVGSLTWCLQDVCLHVCILVLECPAGCVCLGEIGGQVACQSYILWVPEDISDYNNITVTTKTTLSIIITLYIESCPLTNVMRSNNLASGKLTVSHICNLIYLSIPGFLDRLLQCRHAKDSS